MTIDGFGTEEIASALERDKILTPTNYWASKGINRPGRKNPDNPYQWNCSTIVHILSLQEYCGDILNFKTYSKSYKNKKRIDNDRENWVEFKDVHEPFEKIYENNAMGRLSDERFGKLSVKYDMEQKELNKQINELQAELDSDKNKSVSTDEFMAIVRKYTRARKLTPRMLNELIEKIEVYQAEIIDGKKVQRLEIYYNCIGSIEVLDLDLIPDNAVTVNTRQGVDINFAGTVV